MTAYIILQRPERIDIFTDGAAYQDDGTVIGMVPKVFPLDAGVGVVFGRGSWHLILGVAEHARRDGLDFDGVVELLARVAPRLLVEIPSEVCLAGWSNRRQRLEGWIVATHDLHQVNGIPAGKLCPLPVFNMAPPVPESYLESIGWTPSDPDVYLWHHVRDRLLGETFDPRTDGLALMEGQRHAVTEEGDGGDPGCHVVGGFCLWHAITRDGCTDEVLKVWPDKIGEKITPAAAPGACS